MTNCYIGIMSGTSVDAIDAALIEIEPERIDLLDHCSVPIPATLREQAVSLIRSDRDSLNRAYRLGNHLTELYARAANHLTSRNESARIAAVGCHGQTLRHFPNDPDTPFTVQVVNGAMLALETGLPCVTDFRQADIALGGQGAPLAPGFHVASMRSKNESRVVLNLGGIANVTLLPARASEPVIGFDTGPANALMDGWVQRHHQSNFDGDGLFARQGRCDQALLEVLTRDAYFEKVPPKSTGREYFATEWLDTHLVEFADMEPADVQATLLEFSALTISRDIRRHCGDVDAVYACGGGHKNTALMERLRELLAPLNLETTAKLGVDPEWVEAMAFAWLAAQRVKGMPGNIPSVTGASRAAVLGALYLP
jgi:anhydro-N-acetylmuramic acid kinase